MKVTYQSDCYHPNAVTKRYVRYSPDGVFSFCEVGQDRRYDIRQGTVDAAELPESVVAAAIENEKVSMLYVEWPL